MSKNTKNVDIYIFVVYILTFINVSFGSDDRVVHSLQHIYFLFFVLIYFHCTSQYLLGC
jgi:hypothetical protein